MKRLRVLSVIALASLLVSPSAALADDTPCVGTLVGGTYDNVIVPPGASCALLNAVVKGNVKALENAYLHAQFNVIGGNIECDKARGMVAADNTISGNIHVADGVPGGTPFSQAIVARNLILGGNVEVVKNRYSHYSINDNSLPVGNILFAENVTGLDFAIHTNRVSQNLQVFKNKGPALKFVVSNEVGGKLHCTENDPPFVGGPNTARQREGQCF